MVAHSKHEVQVADGVVHSVAVRLVHSEHVGHLQDAGLGRLHRVAPARRDDHERGVGGGGHLDLGLTHTDRLHDHQILARRVQDTDRLGRGERHPA